MAAKKKSSPRSSNAAEKRAEKKKSAPQWGTGRPTAAFTNVGQKATGLAKRPESQRQGGIMSTNKRQTKVKSATGFAGSGGPFSSMPVMAGMSTKKALVGGAMIVAGGRVASGVSIGTKVVVSQATKKLQRELSKEMKSRSGKGMTRQQKQARGESISELSPEERMEYMDIPNQLRGQISRSMKETSKKKRTIKFK